MRASPSDGVRKHACEKQKITGSVLAIRRTDPMIYATRYSVTVPERLAPNPKNMSIFIYI